METSKKTPFYKKKKVWAIALVAIALFFFIRTISSKNSEPQETAKVERGQVKEELVLSGEIKAVNKADLAFGSSGILSWVGVKSGDQVKRGQALAKLDTTALNSAYLQSLSNLRAADATVARVHDDLKNKDTTESFTERETRVLAESAKDKSYDAMVAAQKALRDATITAPFDGLVTVITNETPGLNVTVGTPQVEVVDPKSIYFSVNADQTEVSRFKIGETATVSLDAFGDDQFTGTITAISFTPSAVDSGTVYPMRLTLKVDNSNYKYRVGLTGDAQFVLSQKDNVLFVPNNFIKNDRDGKYVLVGDGTEKKYIEVGIQGDERTEVSGDITEGTVIYN